MKIPFNKPFTVGAELENIADAVRGGHLSGDGPFTQRCHRRLEERLATRGALIAHFKARGIHAVFHYVPLHSSPAGRKLGRAAEPMTVTEDVSERPPLYYALTDSDVAQIVGAIAALFRGRSA